MQRFFYSFMYHTHAVRKYAPPHIWLVQPEDSGGQTIVTTTGVLSCQELEKYSSGGMSTVLEL